MRSDVEEKFKIHKFHLDKEGGQEKLKVLKDTEDMRFKLSIASPRASFRLTIMLVE